MGGTKDRYGAARSIRRERKEWAGRGYGWNLNGNALLLELLRQQHAHDVAGSPGHVMSIISALVLVLRQAPRCTSGLAGNDDNFPRLRQDQASLVEGGTVEHHRIV